MRVCRICVIRFDVDTSDESKDCPKCGCSRHLTMSTEGPEIHAYFNQVGDSLDTYQRYDPSTSA